MTPFIPWTHGWHIVLSWNLARQCFHCSNILCHGANHLGSNLWAHVNDEANSLDTWSGRKTSMQIYEQYFYNMITFQFSPLWPLSSEEPLLWCVLWLFQPLNHANHLAVWQNQLSQAPNHSKYLIVPSTQLSQRSDCSNLPSAIAQVPNGPNIGPQSSDCFVHLGAPSTPLFVSQAPDCLNHLNGSSIQLS